MRIGSYDCGLCCYNSSMISDFNQVRCLVTGHTGFKGFWLSRMLFLLGANVSGIALKPELNSNYSRMSDNFFANSYYFDIRNQELVKETIDYLRPDIIFHLAAQPLVRKSYREPISTFSTNVMGTAHVLDAALKLESVQGVVAITTDKVYKNLEKNIGYKEEDPLGGKDPYSASKSAAEMAINAWRNLGEVSQSTKIISARAGNVIGGGDISEDRLVPDILRSFKLKERVEIRNPNALRPWQHVLDPLYGYILIGKKILNKEKLSNSYNFGPSETSKLTVGQMTDIACKNWTGNLGWENIPNEDSMPESKLLWLNSELAERELGWKNQLNAEETLIWTFEWERKSMEMTPSELIDEQFLRYKNII